MLYPNWSVISRNHWINTSIMHTSSLCKIWITRFALALMIVLFGKKIQNLVNCNLKIFDYANWFDIHGFFLQPSTVVHNQTNTFRSTIFKFNKVSFEVTMMTFFFILIISHVIVAIHHLLTKIMLIL